MSAPRVLIVDDNPAIREVVELVLADDGCEVQARGGDGGALQLLRHWQPDVLLFDMRLPDRGRETFLDVCRKQAGGHTPILVLSTSHNLEHHAARLGLDGILPLPFDIDELCSAVHQLTVHDARTAI
jgi:CheY-like chemotaxis protein